MNHTLPNLDTIGIEMPNNRYTAWFNGACQVLEDLYVALTQKATADDAM